VVDKNLAFFAPPRREAARVKENGYLSQSFWPDVDGRAGGSQAATLAVGGRVWMPICSKTVLAISRQLDDFHRNWMGS
jgi:hypothetical protein